MDCAAILAPNNLAWECHNMVFYTLALGNKYGMAICNNPSVGRIALALLGMPQL